MKKYPIYFLLVGFILYAGVSCQKELSGDPLGNAEGTLDTDIDGGCLPMGIFGYYIPSITLNEKNYIEALVTITKPGSYTINTDTLDGFYFKAIGNFSTTGSYKIKMNAIGKPLTAGMFDFTIFFGATACRTTAVVKSDTVTSGPAEFLFAGTPGTCLNAIVSGAFIKGNLLDNTNSISIKLDVTKPGTYNISTSSINGYRFTGFGSVNAIGMQTIHLPATGTPLQNGTDIFTFNSSISSCSFPVTVTDAVINNDHFPLTANSFWIYDDLLHTGDTIKRTIADSALIGGSMYKRMVEEYVTGLPQEYFFRKEGNDYFEYCSVDKYTSAVSFVPSVNAPIPFLKENAATGTIWKTVEYNGVSVATGKPEMLQYVFQCADADATISINGATYRHVYNVIMEAFTRPDATVPYQPTREINNFFYAKGIGILYMKKTNQFFNRMEIKIRNWQVR